MRKCGRTNCGICSNLNEGTEFYFKKGQHFQVKNNFDCSSENLIYVLTCAGCGHNYIGQTGMSLRKRMTVHRQQIRDPTTRQIALSEHLDVCARNKNPQFTIFPLYQCADKFTEQERINKETLFIQKYNPELNKLQIRRSSCTKVIKITSLVSKLHCNVALPLTTFLHLP